MESQVTFDQFREEWLRDVLVDNPSTLELGRRFARKLITQWRDIDESSDEIVYCDGTGDGGIDIAFLERGESVEADSDDAPQGDAWYLVQSKYGSAFQGTNTLLIEGQKVIETLDGQRSNLSSLAKSLLDTLLTFRSKASENDRIVLLFATEKLLTESEQKVLGNVRAMGKDRLKMNFDVQSVSVEMLYQRPLEEVTGAEVSLPLRADLSPSGESLLVGAVPLRNLYDFLKLYQTKTQDIDRLYEKNIRRFLNLRGKVNKAMAKTLVERPDRFGLYNNGITVVVEDFIRREDGAVELVDPYVVNGCQTTRTIWEVFYPRMESGGTGKSQAFEEWSARVDQGVVVTKIAKVTAGDELLQEITRYTNSQNAVREKDFIALTSDFKTWSRQMAEEYDLYLEIQRGGWDSRRALQRQNPSLRQFKRSAYAFDLIKVYGAGWLKEAGTAFGRNAAFLPSGPIFKQIVNTETTDDPFGVSSLYAAYLLQEAANKYEFGRGSRPSRRQTRFFFYLTVMELLRDVFIQEGIKATHGALTGAVIKLSEPGNEAAFRTLLNRAVSVIDRYLTEENDNSVYREPEFRGRFNSDLNGFLKWEQLGKIEDTTPRFHRLLAAAKIALSDQDDGGQSPAERIMDAVKG